MCLFLSNLEDDISEKYVQSVNKTWKDVLFNNGNSIKIWIEMTLQYLFQNTWFDTYARYCKNDSGRIILAHLCSFRKIPQRPISTTSLDLEKAVLISSGIF